LIARFRLVDPPVCATNPPASDTVPSILLQASGGGSVSWTNSNTSIGLAGSGSGSIPSFKATNTGNNPAIATITIIPTLGNCQGEAQRFTITVLPLSKDVFVPNVFSPNGDGKNDELKVYGNYINKLELRIFNQWGEQMIFINSQTQGWNGTHRGKPQPVGVYAYVLRATLTDGTVINKKGSITLLR
jgi:gliding motility-associated-like protein